MSANSSLVLSQDRKFSWDKKIVQRMLYCQVHRGIMWLLKAIPLQAWTGPEVASRLRLPDFKTVGT
jgi:hypothetical protein